MEKYCALILRYGATFLHGYPSAISIFSNYVLRMGRTDVSERIHGVIAVSEALFAHQRQRIVEAFPNAKVTSFYGMSEKILFGSELAVEAGAYEMEPLYGIAELVDDNGRTIDRPGERGRIVGTGLLSRSMPLIRYDTGDLATLVEGASEKNLFRVKVKDIASRWGQEFLAGAGGQLISMTAINIHSPAYIKMSAFQFHQTELGKATLKVIPAPGCVKDDIVPFINEISAKVGASLTFDIEIVSEIAHNARGKSKFIVQHIDLTKCQ
jgi:phenylacetate-CoA ligase